MKKLFGLLLFFFGLEVCAQEIDSLQVDTLEKAPPANYIGVYGSFDLQLTPNINKRNGVISPGFGLRYNKWVLGFSQTTFIGTTSNYVIFPNVFNLEYRHAGLEVGYEIYESQWMTIQVQASYRWGDMVWEDSETQADFLRDKFNMQRLAVVVEVDKIRYIKPYLIIGYQKMNDLSLARVSNVDFSGLFLGLGARIGYFNQ